MSFITIVDFITSDTMGSNEFEISNEAFIPIYARNSDHIKDFGNFPITPDVVQLIRLVSEYNHGHEHVLNELKIVLNRVTGNYDHFYLQNLTTIYLVNYTPPLHAVHLLPRNEMLLVGDIVAQSNIIWVAEPETGFLRRYFLYLDNDEIPKLPFEKFKDFDEVAERGKYHTNCILNFLIGKYSNTGAKSRQIVAKSIIKFFTADNTLNTDARNTLNTSLDKLHKFALQYKIPLKVFNCVGSEIFALQNKVDKVDRTGFCIMAYKNHAYIYSDNMKKDDVNLSITDNHGIPMYVDSRTIKSDISEQEELIFNEILKLNKPNFMFHCEVGLNIKSFIYTTQLGYDADKDDYTCFDMNKAFYTCLYDLTDKDEKIPVFTVFDDIKECDIMQIDEILDYAYYFICEEEFLKWGEFNKPAFLKGRLNNMLHGFELKFLINCKPKAILLSSIIGVKKPSYTVSVGSFLKTLEKIYTKAEATHPDIKKVFALYNGLFGRVQTKCNKVSLNCLKSDCQLLMECHKSITIEPIEGEDPETGLYSASVMLNKPKYLYLNCRNVYNFVVAKTNLKMMEFINDLDSFQAGTAKRIIKLKTDGIVISGNYDINYLPEKWRPYFKVEEANLKSFAVSKTFINVNELIKSTDEELTKFYDNCISYSGSAGCGKTHEVLNNHEYDEASALTNVACRNLDQKDKPTADTVYSLFRLFDITQLNDVIRKLKNKTLWIDEYSMINIWIWSIVFVVGITSTKKIILTGDKNQCKPIYERFDYNGHLFMKKLLETTTYLTKDYRNDARIIKIREKVLNAESQEDLFRYFRKIFKIMPSLNAGNISQAEFIAIDTHLTNSNMMRIIINKAIISERKLVYEIIKKIPVKPDGLVLTKYMKPIYNFKVSKGVILLARITKKALKVYKGARYVVQHGILNITDSAVLKRILPNGKLEYDKETDELGNELELQINYPITLKNADLVMFDIGYAITAFSSQGLTIKDTLCIHELGQMIKQDNGVAYTSITRACDINKLKLSIEKNTIQWLAKYTCKACQVAHDKDKYKLYCLDCYKKNISEGDRGEDEIEYTNADLKFEAN